MHLSYFTGRFGRDIGKDDTGGPILVWCKPAQPRWSLAAYLSSVNERFKRFLKLACVRSPHTHKRLQQGPLSGDDFDRARSGQA